MSFLVNSLKHLPHKCAIPARSFLILSWDRKVSRYFGIVLSLILNLENLGIDIGIVIEFILLRYWYWYWYPFSNSEVLELILVLNLKTFSIGIVINIEIIGIGIDESIVIFSIIKSRWFSWQNKDFWLTLTQVKYTPKYFTSTMRTLIWQLTG